MNKKNIRKYIKPSVVIIKIDNNISLQLSSTPPVGPGELSAQHSNTTKQNVLHSPI